jgi:starch phosphorylase
MANRPIVAYFSMEIALEQEMPTYSGGLGVLAGDTIRSAADLGIAMVAVSLVHRRGYFRQRLDAAGQQMEDPVDWEPGYHLEAVLPRVWVEIEGRRVAVAGWRYDVRGVTGGEVPVILLDTDLPENTEADRRFTDTLYGGDDRYRLCQEAILGIGGIQMLRALGFTPIDRFHLNEGHAALAVLALLEQQVGRDKVDEASLAQGFEEIHAKCVFTTHTPVQAGHDQFPRDLARRVLGPRRAWRLGWIRGGETLNMTDLALRAAHFVNGVAMRHGEVSQDMFPGYPIHSITNGIHPATWTSLPFRELFDDCIPRWRSDAFALRYAVGIPLNEIAHAHRLAKRELIHVVNQTTGSDFRMEPLTIGFARRATAYKRATLIFRDMDRLAAIAREAGSLQLVFAGKAHPADGEGKALIRHVFEARERLKGHVAVAYLPDYGMGLAKRLVAGCDVWLNTPVPPLEASGTSGMKAALNGVPSLSVLDGWWVEGHVEGVTGWAIGDDHGTGSGAGERDTEHARALYDKLEYAVLPSFYDRRERHLEIMRHCIALNASFFNTQRMLLQYLYDAYIDPPNGAD